MRHLGKMDWRCLVALLVNPNQEYRSWNQISYYPIGVPLVSVELENHTEWCVLKYPSIRVSIVIIRCIREGR